jgi:hypothetical protein
MLKSCTNQGLPWPTHKPEIKYHECLFLLIGISLFFTGTATQSLDVSSTQTPLNLQATSETSSGVATSKPQTCNNSALGQSCDRPRQTLAEKSSASALHDAAARNDHEELQRLIKEGMQNICPQHNRGSNAIARESRRGGRHSRHQWTPAKRIHPAYRRGRALAHSGGPRTSPARRGRPGPCRLQPRHCPASRRALQVCSGLHDARNRTGGMAVTQQAWLRNYHGWMLSGCSARAADCSSLLRGPEKSTQRSLPLLTFAAAAAATERRNEPIVRLLLDAGAPRTAACVEVAASVLATCGSRRGSEGTG